jgi:hypothetical protein
MIATSMSPMTSTMCRAAPASVVIAMSETKPQGLTAWLGHLERQRRRNNVLNSIKKLIY